MLEDIGFYTLSDFRASQASHQSPLWRCEILLTDKCNFKCLYCRGVRPDLQGTLSIDEVYNILSYWLMDGMKNIRFSGGEPTMYNHKNLLEMVQECKLCNVEHIAISTNGSASLAYYKELVDHGVNDFSISLDSGCCAIGEEMTGGVKDSWGHTVEVIRELSKLTYVTVGMVFTENNVDECLEAVLFADSLGVSDIRVIPSAQYNMALYSLTKLPRHILRKYPILNYRITNLRNGRSIRGIGEKDCHKCHLVLDDMAVSKNNHFPCIIYLREGGNPIGKVNSHMREDRRYWEEYHNSYEDPICQKNCLDVCVAYNNKWEELH